MLTIRRLFVISALFATLLSVGACAKQGYPTGGPKDETPPVVVGSQPPNGSLHFDVREFYIYFDEYVTVKDADNNILVSPPMKQKPEYSPKGRGIRVRLKDTLRENTTYLFQFKEGIVDFNEGNALPSYEYVFSTGGSIDSMTLRGKVVDAFTRKPRTEPVTVVAYAESQLDVDMLNDSLNLSTYQRINVSNSDSIVTKGQPLYVTRCDKEGVFALNHLRAGRYMLIALEDGNKNLRLENDEAVAFLDSLVTAVKMPPPPDTTAKDTLDVDKPSDSLNLSTHQPINDKPSDSLNLSTYQHINDKLMLMSVEKHVQQRVTKSGFTDKGKIEIIAQSPLSHGYTLQQLTRDSTLPRQQLYHRLRLKGDTLDVWTGSAGCDSITLLLNDTTGLNDTLRLQYKEPSKPTRGRGLLASSKPRFVQSKVSPSHPYYDSLWIEFINPVEGVCEEWRNASALDTAVRVTDLADSTLSRCGIRLLPDSAFAPAVGMKAYIDFNGKAGGKYRFDIPKGLFYDIFHNPSDSLTITTEFTKTESYGSIHLTLESSDTLFPCPLIVQLTNEKGDMLREQTVMHPCKLAFVHLKGAKYGFRAIVDSNGDGHWTPGNYWLHRQPEEVIFFEKTLELRENWDMEEKWNIGNKTVSYDQ